MGVYGFICGMSLLLSGNTLNYWLASSSIDIKIIGLFAWVALPYSLKYILAILIDKFGKMNLLLFSGDKTYLIFSQFMLVTILVYLSFLNPKDDIFCIAISAFFIAFFSVIQDVVLNGNRISILNDDEQSFGTAMYTVGYRIGMIFSGAGIIFISAFVTWSEIYRILAALYLLIILLMFYIFPDNQKKNIISWAEDSLIYSIFVKPVNYFNGSRNFLYIVLFIIFYLLSDNMLMIMLNPFLLGQGYDAIEIASISKAFGAVMVILGGLVGGSVINKIGIKKSLIIFCIVNMIGHPFFIYLYFAGKNIFLLYFITGYNAFAGGMLTVAYIMFISKLSEGDHAATIYALLSSAMGLSRVIFPSFSGIIVENLGWVAFFSMVFLVSLASIVLLNKMPKEIYNFYNRPKAF